MRYLTALLLAIALASCASAPEPAPSTDPDVVAPLKTKGTVQPPAGCIELRKRGGSC